MPSADQASVLSASCQPACHKNAVNITELFARPPNGSQTLIVKLYDSRVRKQRGCGSDAGWSDVQCVGRQELKGRRTGVGGGNEQAGGTEGIVVTSVRSEVA